MNGIDGKTNRAIAEELQVSPAMIGYYLQGRRYPSLPVMRRIDRVYGWPLMEQIGCIPDIGRDSRYADQFRYWLGAK